MRTFFWVVSWPHTAMDESWRNFYPPFFRVLDLDGCELMMCVGWGIEQGTLKFQQIRHDVACNQVQSAAPLSSPSEEKKESFLLKISAPSAPYIQLASTPKPSNFTTKMKVTNVAICLVSLAASVSAFTTAPFLPRQQAQAVSISQHASASASALRMAEDETKSASEGAVKEFKSHQSEIRGKDRSVSYST